MNSTKRKTRRGVIGIESAIVMIAFVIVAAALAFVVLNMGFSTTQKSKTAITSSIGEASSALEIEGKVMGYGYVTANAKLNATIVPIKVGSGGSNINLDPANVAIKYYSDSVSYDNIYGTTCVLTSAQTTTASALDAAKTAGCISQNPVSGGFAYTAQAPSSTKAIVYWTVIQGTADKILSPGEHAVIAVAYDNTDRPAPLDNVKLEVVLPTGSALTVERTVPSITTNVVDLG